MRNRVIIAGGRNYIPSTEAEYWLSDILEELDPECVLSGKCSGADEWGENVAKSLGIEIEPHPYKKGFGRAGGPIRNEEMARNANICILFPGNKGTADMKRRAIKHGLKIYEYEK